MCKPKSLNMICILSQQVCSKFFCYQTSESLHSRSLLRFYNLLIGEQLNNQLDK